MPSQDGPQPDELRARRVQSRFRVGAEVAAVIAQAAYGTRAEWGGAAP